MNEDEKRIIIELKKQYHSQISLNIFSKLCVLTALATKQPLSKLKEEVILSEFLDSLDKASFVVCIEHLLGIEIIDALAEELVTFKEVLHCVENQRKKSMG